MTTPLSYIGRVWTPPRLWHMAMLLERGYSDAQIARRMDSTPIAVTRVRGRAGLKPARAQHYSGMAVSRAMGVAPIVANRWCQRGWITARKIKSGRHGTWRVTRQALIDFIEDSTYWDKWHPERVSEHGLRHIAYRARKESV